MINYWKNRKNMIYYKLLIEMVNKLNVKTILDVGNGGCPYVEKFNAEIIETTDQNNVYTSNKINGRLMNFMNWQSNIKYDLVTCLQVLEHINNVKAFISKLFEVSSKFIIISVPYKWPVGIELQHVHDPIDENKLLEWIGLEPIESVIATEKVRRRKLPVASRIINLYSNINI